MIFFYITFHISNLDIFESLLLKAFQTTPVSFIEEFYRGANRWTS